MDSPSNVHQEKEPRFVVIASSESSIDYTDKPYILWAPEHATCLEEFILVASWACTRKILEPEALLQAMSSKNYPISHSLVELITT